MNADLLNFPFGNVDGFCTLACFCKRHPTMWPEHTAESPLHNESSFDFSNWFLHIMISFWVGRLWPYRVQLFKSHYKANIFSLSVLLDRNPFTHCDHLMCHFLCHSCFSQKWTKPRILQMQNIIWQPFEFVSGLFLFGSKHPMYTVTWCHITSFFSIRRISKLCSSGSSPLSFLWLQM